MVLGSVPANIDRGRSAVLVLPSLLGRYTSIAERAMQRPITVPLTDGQFHALVSFVFNVGAAGLRRSTLRRKVNGVAERFIHTLKENLLRVHHFETIEELRMALLEFVASYNTHWVVAHHSY